MPEYLAVLSIFSKECILLHHTMNSQEYSVVRFRFVTHKTLFSLVQVYVCNQSVYCCPFLVVAFYIGILVVEAWITF